MMDLWVVPAVTAAVATFSGYYLYFAAAVTVAVVV